MRFTSITGARPTPRNAAGPRACAARPRLTPSAAPGHLLDSDFGPAWRGWRSCAEGDLIDPAKAQIVTGIRRDCEALEVLLKAEARGAQWLILWLDCDREGEAICQEARAARSAALWRFRCRVLVCVLTALLGRR